MSHLIYLRWARLDAIKRDRFYGWPTNQTMPMARMHIYIP